MIRTELDSRGWNTAHPDFRPSESRPAAVVTAAEVRRPVARYVALGIACIVFLIVCALIGTSEEPFEEQQLPTLEMTP